MVRFVAIGIGAGLVSALLVAVMITGSILALAVFFLAPIPIVIASLGWDHRVGLIATFTGAAALSIALHPNSGLVFAIGTGLPAWWLSWLVLLARPGVDGANEWYPLGRLLGWIAALSGALTVAGVLSLGLDYDTYVAGFERAIDVFLRLNPGLLDALPAAARTGAKREIAIIAAALAPPMTAAFSVAITAFTLWAGAKSVAWSGRLARPWPVLADASLPRAALAILVASGLFSLLDGFTGLAARTVLAACVAAFGLQGLAILHKVTRGMAGRAGLLFALYAMTVVLSGWPLLVFAVAGIVDLFVDFRARFARRGAPSKPDDPTDSRRNPWK